MLSGIRFFVLRERRNFSFVELMKKIPRYWITGTAVAIAGVVAARVVAPELKDSHSVYIVVKTLGHLVAFAGIFLIARGISKNAG